MKILIILPNWLGDAIMATNLAIDQNLLFKAQKIGHRKTKKKR